MENKSLIKHDRLGYTKAIWSGEGWQSYPVRRTRTIRSSQGAQAVLGAPYTLQEKPTKMPKGAKPPKTKPSAENVARVLTSQTTE